MLSTDTLLSTDHRTRMLNPDQIDIGTFRTCKSAESHGQFIVELDARPLVALFESAKYGSRLYELMTISDPADVLHYLYLTILDVHEDVLSYVQRTIKFRTKFKNIAFENGISFAEFDSCFSRSDDEASDYERNWLTHRHSDYWNKKTHALLALTEEVQQRIRQLDDFLLQHEITLIDQGLHHRDALTHLDRLSLLENKAYAETRLPAPLFEIISQLIKKEDVQSVSCPLTDYPLWRLLVGEQIRRTQTTGLFPQEAFYLSSSDGGKMNLTGADNRPYPNEPQDWGGTVHVPYEGATGADLFIKPAWHNFHKAEANEAGSLSRALFGKPCRYMLSNKDYGELGCATRLQVGDWVLYHDERAS